MKKLIGFTETFTATVGRRATKRHSDELALCLVNVKHKDVIIAQHSWVECDDNFKGIKTGSEVEFKATVITYNRHSKDKKHGFTKPREVKNAVQTQRKTHTH